MIHVRRAAQPQGLQQAARGAAPTKSLAVVCALGVTLTLGACSGQSSSKSSGGASGSGAHVPLAKATIAPEVATEGGLALAQPITVKPSGGTVKNVKVTGADGKSATGTYTAKTGVWQPTMPLDKRTSYTVTVTLQNSAGQQSTSARTLTTTATGATTTGIYTVAPWNEKTVGNAQPVVITFSQPVPAAQRKAVEQRLKVSDTKGMQGAWRWLGPARLDYRPKAFWPLGDKVTMSGDINGMKIGTTWGAGHLDGTFTVDSDLQTVYDTAKKEVTVTRGGKVIRTMPADSGKAGLETVSGSMVVLGKEPVVRMRSCSVGLGCNPSSPNYYDEQVYKAVQITPTGMYLHAAPWDHQLGRVNSSHGCIHLSAADAAWYFDQVKPGNLVKVTGDANPVSVTNGDGDWNLSWKQWTSAA